MKESPSLTGNNLLFHPKNVSPLFRISWENTQCWSVMVWCQPRSCGLTSTRGWVVTRQRSCSLSVAAPPLHSLHSFFSRPDHKHSLNRKPCFSPGVLTSVPLCCPPYLLTKGIPQPIFGCFLLHKTVRCPSKMYNLWPCSLLSRPKWSETLTKWVEGSSSFITIRDDISCDDEQKLWESEAF